MAARRVSVGIVNHNGESYLQQTLRAVARLGPAVDDVLLIDSGSTDRGVALVREHFPQVRVIELGANLGPGAARNRAIREAAHDRVLLIDNDVEPQPGSVEALGAALDGHSNAILAMAAVLYEHAPDTVQYAGAVPHFLGTPALLQADTPVAQLEDVVRVVGTAITCCVMVDRARFGDRRWFDERLFIYLEDHEFGLRASLQGYDCLIVPEARCLHRAGTIGVSVRETGRFTPIRVRYTIRNRWLTVLMLYQAGTLLRFAPALATFEVLQLLGADPHIPIVVAIYPTNDWHERETYDMFGIVFDGHPALTRILMPDDWPGHPQRKDYPLGRHPGRVQGRHHPAARRAEVVHLMTTDHEHDLYAAASAETAEGRVFTVTGQDWDSITEGIAERAATSASSSTWARSTRRPTACSG